MSIEEQPTTNGEPVVGQSIDGFKRRWWDAQEARFVEDADVPPEDRLTPFENGRRWIIVLEPWIRAT